MSDIVSSGKSHYGHVEVGTRQIRAAWAIAERLTCTSP